MVVCDCRIGRMGAVRWAPCCFGDPAVRFCGPLAVDPRVSARDHGADGCSEWMIHPWMELMGRGWPLDGRVFGSCLS